MAQLKRIFNQGIQKYPFTAHKTYEVTHVNYSSSFELSILRGVSPNGVHTEVSTSKHQGVTHDTSLITGSGAVTHELNKIPQQVIWSSINSTCFKKDVCFVDGDEYFFVTWIFIWVIFSSKLYIFFF